MQPVSGTLSALTLLVVAACGGAGGDATESASTDGGSAQAVSPNQFERGFPVGDTPSRVYDASDLRRAIEAYKVFVPTVATEAVIQQIAGQGGRPNEMGMVTPTSPCSSFRLRTRIHRTRSQRWTSGLARWWSRCPPTLCCSASSTITT